jgi:glycosyltransferase involved in cell wall biosynthesis
MKAAIITLTDLRIYEGTTIRVTGLTKSTSKYLSEVLLFSNTINKELTEIKNIRHIKINHPTLTRILTNLLYITPYRNLNKFLIETLTLRKPFVLDVDIIHTHWILTLPVALSLQKLASHDPSIMLDLHGLFELQKKKRERLLTRALHIFLQTRRTRRNIRRKHQSSHNPLRGT